MNINVYNNLNTKMNDDLSINLSALIKTNIILSFFSLFGSIAIICLYVFRKKNQNFVFNLVFYLSISETLNSIGNIMSIHKLYDDESGFNDTVCDIQAVIINYTDFCSLTWMCIISYTLYDLMINYNQDFSSKRIFFLVFGFGLPFVFTLVQVIIFYMTKINHKNSEGKYECWCWLFHMNENWVAVLIFYIFYWVLIVGNFFVIWRVIRVLKSCVDESDMFCSRIKKMVYKLYMYPLVSAACFVFATMHRMYQIFYISRQNRDKLPTEALRLEVVLYLLHGMFICSRGFIYFLLYGCDKKGKETMKIILGKVYKFFCRKEAKWLKLENIE